MTILYNWLVSAFTQHSCIVWRHLSAHQLISRFPLHFYGHFPGEAGLANDDGDGGDNWTTGAISRAKLQSNDHYQQTNIQFFY